MNAFVLAGEQGGRGQVCGESKAFLLLAGRPLLLHVLMALDGASGIDKIYVVGPRKQILRLVEAALPEVLFEKTIEVLEQKGGILENALYAYTYSLREAATTHSPPVGLAAPAGLAVPAGLGVPAGLAVPAGLGVSALFLSADIPLLTSTEIEQFIQGCDMDRYDYCLGVTPEAALTQFYPNERLPGIKMDYLYLKDRAYRMNNLHLVRPDRIGRMAAIQKMYACRHQRSLWNRLKVIWEVLHSSSGTRGVGIYLSAQCVALLMRQRLFALATLFRRLLTTQAVERQGSLFLGTRFCFQETDIGGSAVDIDDEETYQIIQRVFPAWRAALTPSQPISPAPFRCAEACALNENSNQGVFQLKEAREIPNRNHAD